MWVWGARTRDTARGQGLSTLLLVGQATSERTWHLHLLIHAAAGQRQRRPALGAARSAPL